MPTERVGFSRHFARRRAVRLPMRRLLPFLLLVLAALPASAQLRTSDVVSWRVRADRAVPGETARLVLDAEIQPGWRLYAMRSPVGIPLTLALDDLPTGFALAGVQQSVPREGFDEAFQSDYTYFSERARVIQTLRVADRSQAGERQVTGTLRYAVCDDSVCLPPTRTTFRVSVVVE